MGVSRSAFGRHLRIPFELELHNEHSHIVNIHELLPKITDHLVI